MSAYFLHPCALERIDLVGKPTAALLRFADSEGSGAWGFQHLCAEWDDPQEPDGRFIKVVAPRLTNHVVTCDSEITVRPSILCPDCGLHGFVTESRWEAA